MAKVSIEGMPFHRNIWSRIGAASQSQNFRFVSHNFQYDRAGFCLFPVNRIRIGPALIGRQWRIVEPRCRCRTDSLL